MVTPHYPILKMPLLLLSLSILALQPLNIAAENKPPAHQARTSQGAGLSLRAEEAPMAFWPSYPKSAESPGCFGSQHGGGPCPVAFFYQEQLQLHFKAAVLRPCLKQGNVTFNYMAMPNLMLAPFSSIRRGGYGHKLSYRHFIV